MLSPVLLALNLYRGWSGGLEGLDAPKPLGTVLVKDLVLIHFWTLILNLCKLSILFFNSSAKNCTEDSNVGKPRDKDKQIHHFIIAGFCLFVNLSNCACFLNQFTKISYD